jgi:hypothetical protein
MIEELRNKDVITRADIVALFESIGAAGENRQAKLDAIKQIDRLNFQGISLVEDVESYAEY